jgi:glycosyltransferase involved in cell wall biosynthesis
VRDGWAVPDASGTVVLLTANYPFGSGEEFLDPELPVLARRFAQVIVVPSERTGPMRALPEGVRCDTALVGASRSAVVGELLRHPISALALYARAIAREGHPAAYIRHPVEIAWLIGTNLRKQRILAELVDRRELHEAVFYDYWLANSTLALSRLRRRGVVKKAVARAHGFDLYDERASTGAVPFRAYNVASLDRVFAISSHGLEYLAARHPDSRRRLRLSRLGVPRQPARPTRGGTTPLVVSCASMRSVKRVHLIPRVLAMVGRPVHWVHFGDGPAREAVERAAATHLDGSTFHLAGQVGHDDIVEYYRTHRIDLFVSLSSHEGLPVSIMEAISFGIPVLATSVGGVPEIVNGRSGRLVDAEVDVDATAAAARELIGGGGPAADEIVSFFERNFEAETNYGAFADELERLRDPQGRLAEQ